MLPWRLPPPPSAAVANAAGFDAFASGRSYFGTLGGEATTARVIDVGAVKSINVTYGETITFRNEGKQFTWTFDGLDRRAVELAKIAPSGFPVKGLTIYVPEDPSTRNQSALAPGHSRAEASLYSKCRGFSESRASLRKSSA